MATVNELARPSDVLLFEEGEEVNLVRSAITVISGTAACKTGQVMGQITMAGATETHAGNTGNGAMTLDASPVLANAKPGIYTVKCVTAATNSGTFQVIDPNGNGLGQYIVAAAAFANGIKFTIADGSTDFIVGDTFLVTVAAGSLKWTQVTPAALDGSQYAAGVLLFPVNAVSADASGVIVARGPSILKTGGIVYTSGMTTPQKTTALAQLLALGIQSRTDYGV